MTKSEWKMVWQDIRLLKGNVDYWVLSEEGRKVLLCYLDRQESIKTNKGDL